MCVQVILQWSPTSVLWDRQNCCWNTAYLRKQRYLFGSMKDQPLHFLFPKLPLGSHFWIPYWPHITKTTGLVNILTDWAAPSACQSYSIQSVSEKQSWHSFLLAMLCSYFKQKRYIYSSLAEEFNFIFRHQIGKAWAYFWEGWYWS